MSNFKQDLGVTKLEKADYMLEKKLTNNLCLYICAAMFKSYGYNGFHTHKDLQFNIRQGR